MGRLRQTMEVYGASMELQLKFGDFSPLACRYISKYHAHSQSRALNCMCVKYLSLRACVVEYEKNRVKNAATS